MRALRLVRTAPLAEVPEPLQWQDVPVPAPGPGEVLVRVAVCGVCATELDEAEGRAAPPRLPVTPGHQVVGRVAALGAGVTEHAPGDRVGVAWIHHSGGGDRENLDAAFRATGRDVDGGYAPFLLARAAYAFPIPPCFADAEAAPLLCAGAVGYRALQACRLQDGDALGLTGFGSSAHLVMAMARHLYPRSPVHVFARDASARDFARSLGADWCGATDEPAPTPLAAIVDTTPAWRPVVAALANLRPGGRLVVNALRKRDDDRQALLDLDYERHLWLERELRSVANVTAADVRACLALAAAIPLRPLVSVHPLRDGNRVLQSLQRGGLRGAQVLAIDG